SANSYANVVKKPTGVKETIDGTPTVVLDESCLNNEEFSLCLLGKVTEFASLTILKVVLAKEGFGNIELKYMGGFWVMIVFEEEETMKAFNGNKSVGSWFSQIVQAHKEFVIEEREEETMKAFHGYKSVGYWFSQIVQAHKEFVIEERVIWVEIEGVPCKWWSKNTFNRIASRWGNLLNAEELEYGGYHIPGWVPDFEDDCDNDDDFESNNGTQAAEGPGESVGKCSDLEGKSNSKAIPETRFEDEPMDKFDDINSIPHSKPQSEDPFGVYELLNKKKKVTNNEGESQNSPTYPPGFTPNDNAEDNINTSNVEPVERGYNGDKEDGEFVVSQNMTEMIRMSTQMNPHVLGILRNLMDLELAVDLEREVSKEEVKRAVWDRGVDKAPGPDGFTFGFYRRFWNLIECDVVKAVKWFFLHERIPSGGNSSFITLIPKVSNANMVKDFRPVSLISSVYKI
nr:hypothetical protein [Tanacetum cinerariifolium]